MRNRYGLPLWLRIWIALLLVATVAIISYAIAIGPVP